MTLRRITTACAFALLLARLEGAETNLPEWRYTETPDAAPGTGDVVTIPHTWNTGDIRAGKNKYRRAPSRYETTLAAGLLPAGKRVFARFEGVSTVATVSLDGETLGEHRGHGTAFAFELTAKLKRDGSDRLTVVADNSPRKDVAPLSGDFGLPGGMYRPARLIVKDRVCLSPLESGDFGAQVRQLKAGKDAGELAVKTHVDNAGAPVETTVTLRLKDAAGAVVAEKSVVKTIPAGITEVEDTIGVTNPTLWNGVKNPYLYTLEISLKAADGSTDKTELKTGFRTFSMDPKRGFILNGEPYPLRGVNRHQDRDGKAWAISDADQREDVALIAEMGANVVRAAHYPHAQVFLDECDRRGIFVWAEIPVVDTVGSAPDAFGDNAVSQLRELIRQQSHHAAICVWSIYNEISSGKNKEALPVLRRLNDVAHAEDATRPTAAASNKASPELTNITDVMAFNSYPGWYGGGDGDLSGSMASFKKSAPNKAWGISEYGAGAGLSQQDDTISKGPKPTGRWHPEAWQSRVHEHALASIQKHPELWGTFAWNMFDFAVSTRHEGETDGLNDKGLVTFDRKTRKDAFYLYQANWSKTPVLHLLARRDDKRKSADTVIRYYTNLKDVVVKFDGKILSGAKPYAPAGYVFDNIRLVPGKNTIEAEGRTASGETVTDRVEWTLAE